MATESARPRTAIDRTPSRNPDERRTSITAHIVRSVCVTMSEAELHLLLAIHERAEAYLYTDAEKSVVEELRDRVNEIT